jgi:HEPN domain-containing protein
MEDAKRALSREWLQKAFADLRSARILGEGKTPIFDTALFHCQQAAEKALKGFLVYHDTPFEKTHNLTAILDLAVAIDSGFPALADDAALLTPYAIMHRYPDEKPAPNERRFKNALAATERVYRFVLARQPELDPEKA